MTYGVGTPITLDEQSEPREAVCEFGCTHQVRDITRRSATIVEEKQVDSKWEDSWAGLPPGTTKRSGYRATDTDGTDWFRDWDGWRGDSPGASWFSGNGRRAVQVHSWDTVEKKYGSAARSNAPGYTFTDLTTGKEA